jgi:hypothetical protein
VVCDIEPWQLSVVLEVYRDKAVNCLRPKRTASGTFETSRDAEGPPKLKIGIGAALERRQMF